MRRTVYLIHHSHTDVGYTELQGRIADRHVDFIRQSLGLIEVDQRFRWTCETFWAVEQFLRVASSEERERFVAAVKSGHVGLSAGYLNFSELLDYPTHGDLARRVKEFGDAHGIAVTSAMTADVNGHSFAYAQALADHGVSRLFACVHTHHGMYPLFKNQTPFYWRMPNGGRLLVWNGEHYHLGNELGLVPGAFMTHMVDDAVRLGEDGLAVAERRVSAYWKHLDEQGYPYSFVPLMVSGLMTDNAPPAPRLTDFIDAWNARHGEEVRLVLATLDTFFDALLAAEPDIPEYAGLWPDWWADLTVAAPAAVRIFREAQRHLGLYRSLVRHRPDVVEAAAAGPVRREEVEDRLALFAEHTFGHSASFTHPDHLLVAACSLRKSGFAAEAFEGSVRLLDAAAARLGAARFEAGRPLRFTLINPHSERFVGPVRMELDQFECGDVEVRFEQEGVLPAAVPGFIVADAETGRSLPSQAVRAPRGVEVIAWLEMGPGESKGVEIQRNVEVDRPFIKVIPHRGIDGAHDVAERSMRPAASNVLESPFVRIEWAAEDGIISWVDLVSGREVLDPERRHHAFTPIHEVSPGSPRTPMGRNRKSIDVRRSIGRLTSVREAWACDVFSTVLLEYRLAGPRSCSLFLRAYRSLPLVEAELSLHKESTVDVESLYLSLPLRAGPEAELWIDSSVCAVRPWKDQIPGTLTDFFHVYEGMASLADGFGLGIAMPDTPLLQLGDLDVKPRILAGAEALRDEPMRPYVWLMNNFWETNANIDLAGFYRFRFSVFWGETFDSPDAVFRTSRYLNQGPVTFRRA